MREERDDFDQYRGKFYPISSAKLDGVQVRPRDPSSPRSLLMLFTPLPQPQHFVRSVTQASKQSWT